MFKRTVNEDTSAIGVEISDADVKLTVEDFAFGRIRGTMLTTRDAIDVGVALIEAAQKAKANFDEGGKQNAKI